jgi:uncharacterized protein YkwD
MTPLRPQFVAAASIRRAGRGTSGCRCLLDKRLRPVEVLALTFIAIASSILFGWLVLAAPAGATANRSALTPGGLELTILTRVNAVRLQNGLAPLRRSSGLTAAARQHSTEMAARGYFGHSSADGSSFERRIARFYPLGRRHYWSVGENLLWSTSDVDAAGALDTWLRSPEHRRNILMRRWRDFGLGAVRVVSAPGVYGGRAVTIVTTDFGVRR